MIQCAEMKKLKKAKRDALNSKKKEKLSFLKILLLILSGAIIGTLNGFFGGGGGMVCVPILEKVLKLENKQAHATAILVIFPLSLLSAGLYVYFGYVSTIPLAFCTLGTILGGILGSFALSKLRSKTVRILFAIVMLAGGVRLLF